MTSTLVQMAEGFYRDEVKDHVTYTTLAHNERQPELRAVLSRIAGIELRHSEFWKKFIESRGMSLRPYTVNRIKLGALRVLQKLMSSTFLVSILELGESNAFAKYLHCLRTAPLAEHEKSELRKIILDEIEHELTFRNESRKLGTKNVRDYVLGMNDGLVEILGAVTGLSAVYAGNPRIVGISGLVVGIAGAMSMGIGAFISVRSQRQVNESLRERMEILFEVAPSRAVAEYRERLAESGVPADTAADVAQRVGINRDAIGRLLLPEPDENELRSGLFTGFAYLLGVMFPILPYFFATNSLVALAGSVILAGLALASTAVVVSVLSGISLKKKVIEMLVAGFSAAAIAYAFGSILRSVAGVDP